MKKFISHFLAALSGLGAGVLLTLVLLNSSPYFSSLLLRRPASPPAAAEGENPFQLLQKMHESMEEEDGLGMLFHSEDAPQISTREDKNFVYYDVALPGVDGSSVDASVQNGQVTITGQMKKQTSGPGVNSFFSSSFQRSVPVPPHTDPKGMDIANEKDKLVLKFPKLR